MPIKIVRTERHSFLYGPVSALEGMNPLPGYVKYHGAWPKIRVIFQQQREPVSRKVSVKKSGKQWSCSLPARDLGIPVLPPDYSLISEQVAVGEFLLDFTGVCKENLTMEAMNLLLQYASIQKLWRSIYATDIESVTGVHITWSDDS